MNRKELLEKVNTYLARFTQEVKQSNAASQYDINVHAENVLIPLLKEVYGYTGLQNANTLTKNAPAVDLIDYESRVAIQVTATADADKITHTLTKFVENEQHKPFEHLLIYIITERQATYRKDFKTLLPEGYDFDPDRDIIDNVSLYKRISEHVLNAQSLARISRLLTEEFSEQKIDERKTIKEYSSRNDTKSDRLFPNLLEMTVPQKLYISDLNFDFDYYRAELQTDLKQRKKYSKLRHLSEKDDLKFYFQQSKIKCSEDYILFEKKILTFRDLHESSEPLRNIIDLGTITAISPNEFINDNSDRESVFKKLLTSVLTYDLRQRHVEWIHSEKVYRFRMTFNPPKPIKVQWKSKAGRSVIAGVKSKVNEKTVTDEDGSERIVKGKHYVCYRHLAFSTTFNYFSDKWYISLKPDYSFTSPADGYRTSPFAELYTTGMKKLERNAAVLESFQFLAGYLIEMAKGDMVTTPFTLKFSEFPQYFKAQPSIPDDIWSQSEPKGKKDKDQFNIEFEE